MKKTAVRPETGPKVKPEVGPNLGLEVRPKTRPKVRTVMGPEVGHDLKPEVLTSRISSALNSLAMISLLYFFSFI